MKYVNLKKKKWDIDENLKKNEGLEEEKKYNDIVVENKIR